MTDPAKPRAGVIDIGSNTIKILVGERRNGAVHILADETVECRISAGMYAAPPLLGAEAMQKSVEAVRTLLSKAKALGDFPVEIVATSALRDAANREAFAEMLHHAVSRPLKILSGEEEAQGIARGIGEERGLDPLSEYTVSDLGGGSLEWIHHRKGRVENAESLDLGAVRLLNRFVEDPEKPLSEQQVSNIRETCRILFADKIPKLSENAARTHWGTGGAFTITRLLMATEQGKPFREQPREIPVDRIRSYAERLGRLALPQRKTFPGLPETRADILPVALVIIATLADHLGVKVFRHSFNNLRMGRLVSLLEAARDGTH